MPKRILIFTLQTFSTTGGIQKMTRTLGYSLHRICSKNNWDFKMFSAYDADTDLMPQYLPVENFKGFNINRTAFVMKSLKQLAKADAIILSHINLAIIGLAAKIINPECKIYLVAHGIEVWRPLSFWQKKLLKYTDKVICVSNFTQEQMVRLHNIKKAKCAILNNAIDPFMQLPSGFKKPVLLLEKYKLTPGSPVIFTLTRLAATEQYKGHEQVIKVLGKLKAKFPAIKYILAGQYDHDEEVRINELIALNDVAEQVILTGFIDEKDLPDHFLLADVFVLPSKKEGFGIVFIEALACGLPVICGNSDGSVDAIRNGELGKAIDVTDTDALEAAITAALETPVTPEKRECLQKVCVSYFNEQDYRKQLEQLLLA
jgi:phosphatidylinositol alpha-1,6-mannosyltransferase